ncbi:MAG: hypothetical protein V2B13_06040, partial [Pseudomonadota bacterium]
MGSNLSVVNKETNRNSNQPTTLPNTQPANQPPRTGIGQGIRDIQRPRPSLDKERQSSMPLNERKITKYEYKIFIRNTLEDLIKAGEAADPYIKQNQLVPFYNQSGEIDQRYDNFKKNQGFLQGEFAKFLDAKVDKMEERKVKMIEQGLRTSSINRELHDEIYAAIDSKSKKISEKDNTNEKQAENEKEEEQLKEKQTVENTIKKIESNQDEKSSEKDMEGDRDRRIDHKPKNKSNTNHQVKRRNRRKPSNQQAHTTEMKKEAKEVLAGRITEKKTNQMPISEEDKKKLEDFTNRILKGP